ncbi:MAG: acyl-CoA--6-aminopenicillanic acid acyl-transferase [Flavobacteriales bacterium]|nr:acyl-CoA--6-aminopenicillanic acid acyl-transferase [Flavobacteriales bacterium]
MSRLLRLLILAPLLLAEALWAIAVIGGCALLFDMRLTVPLEKGETFTLPERRPFGDRGWITEHGRLSVTDHGLWEAYVEGPDLERGLTVGVLAKELIEKQETLFVDRIKMLVPDARKLGWLKYFVNFFNRDIEDHVPLEYRREIYGESRSFSPAFEMIGSGYERALNYHAAHDIGHALQDLAFVGCTSFAAWEERTADGGLLIGRNFDFYLGEEFACDKVLLFMRPEKGFPFVEVTWGGMLGAVSGMNLEGLTVTINASRSALPTGAHTPISLLAREILQYATTIHEAVAIAQRRDVFVSESILVGSAKDGRAAVIEKAPDGMGVFDPGNGLVVCANHYQSDTFRDTEVNKANIRDSDSMSRFKRMTDLTSTGDPMTPIDAVRVLRERTGPDGASVGLGNPIAIDQLIAHHSVVFQPAQCRMWISVGPYTLGEYLAYDLRAIFARTGPEELPHPLYDPLATLPADTLLKSPVMADFTWHRAMRAALIEHRITGHTYALAPEDEARYVATDPDNALTYSDLAEWYRAEGDRTKAVLYFDEALTRTVSSAGERAKLQAARDACARN